MRVMLAEAGVRGDGGDGDNDSDGEIRPSSQMNCLPFLGHRN